MQEQAAALQSMGLSDYEALKARLLLTTALLTAGGSGIAAAAAGPDAAAPFALGGLAGLLYQLLLQLGADAAVAQAASTSPGGVDSAGSLSSTAPSSGTMSAAVTSFSAAAARSRGTRVPAVNMTPQFMAEPVSQEDFQGRTLRVMGSAPFRLLVLSTAALFGIWLVQGGNSGELELGQGCDGTSLVRARLCCMICACVCMCLGCRAQLSDWPHGCC